MSRIITKMRGKILKGSLIEMTDEIIEETVENETIEETKPDESLPELVDKVREEYEKRIADIEAKHKSELEDRDTIIQQLISGGALSATTSATFIDRLNEKRNYKKW